MHKHISADVFLSKLFSFRRLMVGEWLLLLQEFQPIPTIWVRAAKSE